MSIDKKQLTKLVSYMAAFDGGLYRRENRHGNLNNAQFIMNMRKCNIDYIEWVKSVLENVTSVTVKDRKDYNTDGFVRAEQVRLETRCHPFFTTLHSRMYMDGKKVIDPHMLTLMDAESLAIIFMADGSVSKGGYVSLNTKGYSYADNMSLSKAIYDATGIKSNINRHGQYYYLRVPVKDSGNFYRAVKPYVTESFNYKLERLAPLAGDGDIVCTPQ